MKYFSMFSGIGGFEVGINKAIQHKTAIPTERQMDVLQPTRNITNSNSFMGNGGWSCPICIGFSEVDKYAIQIYQKHFKEHKNYGDCTRIDWKTVPYFDLLVGGFPCQAFSIAGKRHGFSDTRGTLFFEIARCLKEKQPRLCLLENVKGLLSHDKGSTFLTILATLDELGYDLQWQVLNSKNFGVPQNRERVFIIGHLRGTSRPEVFPIGESNQESIKSDTQRNDVAHTITNTDKHRGSYVKSDISQGVSDSRSCIRRLTPTECERLQGFPDGWTEGISDTQRYKCLGNAVTVNVIQAIMEKLLQCH